jgi:hypothetical protein
MWVVRKGHDQGGWEGKLRCRKMKITVKGVD